VDFTHYASLCVQMGADLVNTKGSTTGNEYLGTPDEVRTFLEAHEIGVPSRITQRDVEELHEVRDRLRRVFFAPGQAEAAGLLNKLIDEFAAKPYLTDHDGQWHFHYAPESAPIAHKVVASSAMALATVVAEFGYERLGSCAADDCQDVYVDMSRNRSRRYCDEGCSSRMNVAAFRARSKTKQPS
jgi:predicted RNA-binding Zn ribbon-like protein